ncbi:hypothetical protein FOVG_19098 [Fusarium oxysporum f. sp. pisi HDV247]|uniref:Uncharacterized protein n=1 Tax=Fusarium oxysporum f. sp. pisi HDV247 TaxID=1080344 RepID=W9NNJ3_FUSOX|nr:hypothetical protein FOVG_19098 [Fusarium oxysporum f. sp. pisi HDV247]
MAMKNASAFTFTALKTLKLTRGPKFQRSMLNRKQAFPMATPGQTWNMPPRSAFGAFHHICKGMGPT